MATAGRTINTSIYLKRSFRKWMGVVLLVLLILCLTAGSALADDPIVIKMENEILKKGGENWNISSNFLWLESGDSGRSYRLDSDIDIKAPIQIQGGYMVTLDLNGKTINRGLTEATDKGYVFYVSSNQKLTITDSRGGGIITGGYNKNASGAIKVEDGEFILKSGSITGNKTSTEGGAVYFSSSSQKNAFFTMEGGSITNNVAAKDGGGVYMGGAGSTFTMKGGTISGNISDEKGGGVCVHSGTFVMTGGTISGNTAKSDGGGVDVWQDGIFQLSGAPTIKGNTYNGVANDVALAHENLNIQITGPMTGGEIYVNRTLGDTVGVAAGSYTTITETDASKFFSKDGKYVGILTENRINVVFGEKKPLTDEMVTMTSVSEDYTGSAFAPVVVKDGDRTLTLGTDYTLSYLRDGVSAGEIKEPGTYTITVTGAGGYYSIVTRTFTVNKGAQEAAVATPTPAPISAPTPMPTSLPKTGDDTPLSLWFGLILLGLAGCGWILKNTVK